MRATAADHDLASEDLDRTAMAGRFPQHALDPDEVALFDPQAGFVQPELAVMAAASRAQQLGAELRSYQRVTAVEPGNGGVTVRTRDDAHRFDPQERAHPRPVLPQPAPEAVSTAVARSPGP